MRNRDLKLEDFSVGDYVVFRRKFSRADYMAFAKLSGDWNPLHSSLKHARQTEFSEPIVPVHLAAALLSAIAGMVLPGRRALYLGSNLRAINPIKFDQEITYSAKVVAKGELANALTLRVLAFDKETVFLEADIRVAIRDHVPPPDKTEKAAPWKIKNSKDNRWALVTGASGEIGRAVSKRLAQNGWNLILNYYSDRASAEELAKQCRIDGVEAKPVKADLASSKGLRKLVDLVSENGEVTCLVHAASPPVESSMDALMAINYQAIEALGNALLHGMLCRQEGIVTLVGSSALQVGSAKWANYIAAKAAAVSYLEGLRRHYGSYGVRPLTVAPGFVATSFSQAYRAEDMSVLEPEEVADLLVSEITDGNDSSKESYIWLESSGVKRGSYGFYADGGPVRKKLEDEPVRQSEQLLEQKRSGEEELASLVKNFFKLPPQANIEYAGLDITPGWDSLRHIELMLYIEENLGIYLKSGDIESTTTFQNLSGLISSRISGED